MKTLARLFADFFRISLFVLGGGYAIAAVADDVFARRGWTKEGEVVDRLPVFQMVPGLMATHTAVYVGSKVAGAAGAAVSVLAVALPSLAVFTLVSVFYAQLPLGSPVLESAFVGLRASLTGVLAATVIRGWRRNLDGAFAYAIMAGALAAIALGGFSVPLALLAAILVGLASEFVPPRRTGRTLNASLLPLLVFLRYGALCFGGGFALVPMYLEDFVGATAPYLNVTPDDFASVMALTQMTPGPIGVNCATYFGYRLNGLSGAALATAALLLPGSFAAYFAFRSLDRFRTSRIVRGILRGARPASVALILVALGSFASMSLLQPTDGGGQATRLVAAVIIAATTALVLRKKLAIPLVIILSAAASAGLVPWFA